MSVLNEPLTWEKIVEEASRLGRENPASGFLGTPEKTLLLKERMLCRFITCGYKDRPETGNNVYLSPWWSEWESTIKLLNQFKTVPAKEVVRGKLAVTHAMNKELDGLVQIVLTHDVYAWKGRVKYQNEKQSNLCYIGGGTQIYLPNLTTDEAPLTSPVARMHSFTWTDSLHIG